MLGEEAGWCEVSEETGVHSYGNDLLVIIPHLGIQVWVHKMLRAQSDVMFSYYLAGFVPFTV